jgi:hypothetical protein
MISQKQNVLGLAGRINNENRIYFYQTSLGKAITSRNTACAAQARAYLSLSMKTPLELVVILEQAGATVVHTPPDGEYVDLSPQALEKTTIISLLQRNTGKKITKTEENTRT